MRTFNCVVFGAGGVGKSTLIVRWITSLFVSQYDPTIEECYQKGVTTDGETSILEVTDTAGVEQFRTLNEMYMKSGDGFILVFSLIHRDSLHDIESLRRDIIRMKGDLVPIVVVGTKSDLVDDRQVNIQEIEELCHTWGVPYYETSAKWGQHVNDPFEDLVRQMRLKAREKASYQKKRRRGKKLGGCIIV